MVSILLSVWNMADALESTFRSIFAQTYQDWEIVAVDDGSTDDTMKRLVHFREHFPKQIRLLQNRENVGLTRSLVLAAEHAQGRYLARIDAGDIFLPEKLEKQVAFLDVESDHGIIGCNYRTVFQSRATSVSSFPLTDAAIRKSILRKNPFAHSCILMRADAYRRSGGYDVNIRYGQDYELWFRMMKIARMANLPEILCIRTMDFDSISYKKQRTQMWQCIRTQFRYMRKWDPLQYRFLLDPLAMLLMPEPIKKYFRQHQLRKKDGLENR